MVYKIYKWDATNTKYVAIDAGFQKLECRDTSGCLLEFQAPANYTNESIVMTIKAGVDAMQEVPVFTGKASCVESDWEGNVYTCKARSWVYYWLQSAIKASDVNTSVAWFLKRASVVTDPTLCINYLGCPAKNIVWIDPPAGTPPQNYNIVGENILFEIRSFIEALHRGGFYIAEGVERVDVSTATSEVRSILTVMGGTQSATTITHDANKWFVRGFSSSGSGTIIVRGWSDSKATFDDLTFLDDGTGTYYTANLSYIPEEGTLKVYALTTLQDGTTKEYYELCPEIDYTLDWNDGPYSPPRLQLLNPDFQGVDVRARYKGKRYVEVTVGSGAPVKVFSYHGGDPTLPAGTTGSPEDVFTKYANKKLDAIQKPANFRVYQPLAYIDASGNTVFFEVFTEDWVSNINSSAGIVGAPLVGAQVKVTKGATTVYGIVRSWKLTLTGSDLGVTLDITSPVKNIDLAEPFKSFNVKIEQILTLDQLRDVGSRLTSPDGRIVPV